MTTDEASAFPDDRYSDRIYRFHLGCSRIAA